MPPSCRTGRITGRATLAAPGSVQGGRLPCCSGDVPGKPTSSLRAAADGGPVKVILETCALSPEERRRGAQWTRIAGAAFVKTSTGFAAGGATEDDVRLLRAAVGPDFGVKAAGGIRDAAAADRMIAAGANRLGTSAGVAIVTESKMEGRGY